MKIIHLETRIISQNKAIIKSVVEGDLESLPSSILGKDYELIIKPTKKKRSLTANSYYQVLLDELNKILKTDREELHEHLLRRYGVTKTENGSAVLFTLRADINPHQVCKYVDIIKASELNGKKYIHYRVLKGSSEMDSSEFANLLDGLISECKELGIETLPSEEVKLLRYE